MLKALLMCSKNFYNFYLVIEIRGESFTTLGTGTGYNWVGYENFSKDIWGSTSSFAEYIFDK